ncbi:MAG: histidine kinase, partial [Streptosporangiaceae bacterium]
REMHDVLAHRLSLLATYAGALEYRPDAPPEKLAHAAGVIRSGVHQALTELRDVLTVLREDDTDDFAQGAQPVLADLPRLLAEAREAGTPVELTDGTTEPGSLPATLSRTGYRVVQEGLTNARKHAPGRTVRVTLGGAPGERLTIVLANPVLANPVPANPVPANPVPANPVLDGPVLDGPVLDGPVLAGFRARSIPGSGTGLIGLTERVRLAGGRIDHRVVQGEFLLEAWLPFPACSP